MFPKVTLIICGMSLVFSVSSCRNDEMNPQKINQVIQIYFKNNSSKDLLNSKLQGSYKEVKLFDLNDKYDRVPINSFSIKKDADTMNYIEYIAGAKRLLKDSISPSEKIYQSDMIIQLNKVVDNKTISDEDTIQIQYNWTPTLFQISKAYYNQKLVFNKTTSSSNIISVVK